MARNTSKSPSEIRLELETKLERAKLREAKAMASDNPTIAKITNLRDSVSKDIAVLSRQLKGPQSFENRRKAFELRLVAIEAGERLAIARDTNARRYRDYLETVAQTALTKIASGGTFTDEDYNTAIENAPIPDDVENLEIASEIAERNWRDFAEEKNVKKSENVIEAQA